MSQTKPDIRLVKIVLESMKYWDTLGKPYPEHLQSTVNQLKLQKRKEIK